MLAALFVWAVFGFAVLAFILALCAVAWVVS
jgi:hypothetical protein